MKGYVYDEKQGRPVEVEQDASSALPDVPRAELRQVLALKTMQRLLSVDELRDNELVITLRALVDWALNEE
jgi:hypothetical protein